MKLGKYFKIGLKDIGSQIVTALIMILVLLVVLLLPAGKPQLIGMITYIVVSIPVKGWVHNMLWEWK